MEDVLIFKRQIEDHYLNITKKKRSNDIPKGTGWYTCIDRMFPVIINNNKFFLSITKVLKHSSAFLLWLIP